MNKCINVLITDMKKTTFGKLVMKLQSGDDQIKFLQDANILHKTKCCPMCDKVLEDIYKDKNYHYFKCHTCNKKVSIRSDTILSNSNISLRRFALLSYLFVNTLWGYSQIKVSKNKDIIILKLIHRMKLTFQRMRMESLSTL